MLEHLSMKGEKVAKFIKLSGREISEDCNFGSEKDRELGAQLLLSELLEYIIKGLGVSLSVDGTEIKDPESVVYRSIKAPNPVEALDGLADVAYTLWWNALTFGLPVAEAYEMVCDNNLEKFVPLKNWTSGSRDLNNDEWHCQQGVEWPESVTKVVVVPVGSEFYAVGFDRNGKVRKPSSYKSVDLSSLLR